MQEIYVTINNSKVYENRKKSTTTTEWVKHSLEHFYYIKRYIDHLEKKIKLKIINKIEINILISFKALYHHHHNHH